MLVYQRVPRKIQHGQMKSACSVGPYFSNLPLGHQIVRNFPHWSWRFSSPGNHRTTCFFPANHLWVLEGSLWILYSQYARGKNPHDNSEIHSCCGYDRVGFNPPKKYACHPNWLSQVLMKQNYLKPPNQSICGRNSNEVRYGSASRTGHAAVVSPWLHI